MTELDFREDPGEDAAFRRLLIERLPRYAAPAALRAAILSAGAPAPGFRWWAPALGALAAALVIGLVGLPFLPRAVQPDTLQPIVRAALSEHARSLLWGQSRPEGTAAALPRLVAETGISLSWFFRGDDEVQLVDAAPLIVEGRRALALTYTDKEGRKLTYLVLPGAGMALPERGRVEIDRFRPLLTRVNSFSLFAWIERDLACFLISDLVSERDLPRFKEFFLKVRLASEPPRKN